VIGSELFKDNSVLEKRKEATRLATTSVSRWMWQATSQSSVVCIAFKLALNYVRIYFADLIYFDIIFWLSERNNVQRTTLSHGFGSLLLHFSSSINVAKSLTTEEIHEQLSKASHRPEIQNRDL
jgi:hypothetical protein